MGGVPLESYPSSFIFRHGDNSEHALILNIYVDDLTLALAGGNKEVQTQFWKDLKLIVKLILNNILIGMVSRFLALNPREPNTRSNDI
jgi:hypothetical protein